MLSCMICSKIVLNFRRNIFSQHVTSKRERQPGFLLPPFAEVDNFFETGLRIGELSLVND